MKPIVASFVRSSGTTAYAVNQSISTTAGAIITFSQVQYNSVASGWIHKARLSKNSTGVTAPTFKLALFRTAVTALADYAAWQKLDAAFSTYLGTINFPTMTAGGAGGDSASAESFPVNLPFYCQNNDTTITDWNIYGQLIAADVYAPAAGEKFSIELTLGND